MSKYNLQDILNEYVGGSRHGTIKISYRDLQDAMDTIERQGDFVVRELPGPSGDGKTNREFEVVYIGNVRKSGKEEGGFTVYDYKFGFDPGDEMHFDEEYEFSIGGNNKRNALILARDLLGPAVKGYFGDDQKIVNSYTPQMANDVIMSLDRNMDDEGEMTDYAADVEIDSINEEEMSKSEKKKLKKVSSQLKKSVKAHDKQSKVIDKIVNEGDLFSSEFDRAELKDIINDLNKGLILDMPTRRAYKFLVSLLDKQDKEEMGLNEQMYIDDEEFEMEMGRSKKDSLKKEMMFHFDELLDGNIDMNDFMNVVEDMMAELKSMNENGHVDDYADEIEEGHAMSDNEADLEAGVKGNMDAFTEDMDDPILKDLEKTKEFVSLKDRTKNMDQSEKEKFLKALNQKIMVKEAVAEEESVGQYIIDYYRNPNKPEEMYVTDDIVIEYFRTHPDWDLIWGKSYEEGLDDFKEFMSANYDYMFDDARLDEEDKKKKELPDSIKKAEQDQIEKDARKSRGDIKEDTDEDSLNEVRKHFKRFMFDKYQ